MRVLIVSVLFGALEGSLFGNGFASEARNASTAFFPALALFAAAYELRSRFRALKVIGVISAEMRDLEPIRRMG